jgi:proteasome lid subunit RPN8/RPN11
MDIDATLLGFMEKEARAALPKESCGLLVGQKNSNFIQDVIPAPNLSPEPNQFFIDPEFHLKTQRDLRIKNLEIIGVYHSHPIGDSTPSRDDEIGPHRPGFYWLITSFDKKGDVTSHLFREKTAENPLTSRNFEKVNLQIKKFVA